MARMSDTRLRPEPAYAADGWSHGADLPSAAAAGRDTGQVLRALALVAVAVGLAALTAAACVLSYSSVHHLALQAGVHGRLASIYPIIFDALLVIAGCSVLALRGAGLVSRMYSWLCMLVLLAALAAGGALQPADVKIPHKLAAVVAAIVPWALVLIGFGLLVALLRYARLRRLGKRNEKRRVALEARRPELAPAMVGAPVIPVTELESEEFAAQRPLIPGLPPRPQAITASDHELTEDAGEEEAALETADPASGSTGVEPPTVPNRTGNPPAVRRVEMQLRARTSKSQEQDTAGASPTAPARQTPFTPKVERGALGGQDDNREQPDPVAEDELEGSDDTRDDSAVEDDALPKRVPGQQPATAGFESRDADPATDQEPSAEPTAAEPSAEDDGDTDGLPAFRRTRSTPTPPQDD